MNNLNCEKNIYHSRLNEYLIDNSRLLFKNIFNLHQNHRFYYLIYVINKNYYYVFCKNCYQGSKLFLIIKKLMNKPVFNKNL